MICGGCGRLRKKHQLELTDPLCGARQRRATAARCPRSHDVRRRANDTMSAASGNSWCAKLARDVAEGAARSAVDAQRQAEAVALELG
jgi:hypothetical protein